MSLTKGTSLDIGVGAISRASGRGNTRASVHNILKGKNWSGSTPFLEQPVDRTGVIFISRTDLNLSRENLKGIRRFESLIGTNMLSTGRAIAGILDPRTSRSVKASPLIDPLYGFNSLLDNTITSCTGWPNNVIEVTPTPPNEKGASTIIAEGKIKDGKTFDLNLEHLNTEGDMISQMYSVLTRYSAMVRNGDVGRYWDNIINDRVDYKSRIYRFVFDKTGTRVEQFTMTGEAFPISDSVGNAMNFSNATATNEGYDTISSQWKCGGFFHQDPIVIDEFNRTQVMHNPTMADGIREKTYYKIGTDEGVASLTISNQFQYMGYPRINPLTLEFEIWVPNLIKTIIGNYNSTKEFVAAMVAKNDADLTYGTKEYNQAAFRKVVGWSYTDLPPAVADTSNT